MNATMQEFVVTGTRTQKRKAESAVAVDILNSRTFRITQSNTLADGLCFSPGLRMETDCQTCNYSQLRMNGLGGAYSQILINSRPVFSSLMSLYGLEQIPANMIERVEVVRGGGSVLYGASAIAGTVNVITKKPQENAAQISNNFSLIGGTAKDNFGNANITEVSADKTKGISIFGSRRDKQAYDANGDGFSEMPRLINNSVGFNSFLNFSETNKLEVNGWYIDEYRQGGNKVHQSAEKAEQSEFRHHQIVLGGFNFEHQKPGSKSWWSVYASAQKTKRRHYTGIDGADAWGNTKNYSFQGGLQYNLKLNHFLKGTNTLTTGFENQYEYTFDQIPLYHYLIDQHVNLTGVFLQSDWEISKKLTLLSGVRVNKSNRVNNLIITPKISALFKPNAFTQFRASYARGFKAPQAFETDMHIAFANGGVSIIRVNPTLIAETSNAFNASIDFDKPSERIIYGYSINAFYTRLNNALSSSKPEPMPMEISNFCAAMETVQSFAE